MIPPEPSKSVPAVENAIKILRHLAASGSPQGIAVTARATSLSVSTTFKILKTLSKEGLIAFDAAAKTYSIGMGIMELVAPILGTNSNDLIRPLLEGMADEHRVLIALWQLTSQERIVLIDAVTPPNIVHASVHKGARLPAFAGAVGRCYAAYSGIGKKDARSKYNALRWENPPGFEAYWQDVEKAREQGYAFDFENLFGGLNLASSIACDRNGDPRFGVSTITISGQTTREALMRIAVDLKNAAELIEANIFGVRRPLRDDPADQRQPALQESGDA